MFAKVPLSLHRKNTENGNNKHQPKHKKTTMGYYKRHECTYCNGSGSLYHHYGYEYGKEIYETCPYCRGVGYHDIWVDEDVNPW